MCLVRIRVQSFASSTSEMVEFSSSPEEDVEKATQDDKRGEHPMEREADGDGISVKSPAPHVSQFQSVQSERELPLTSRGSVSLQS